MRGDGGGGPRTRLDEHPLLGLLEAPALVAEELVLPIQHLSADTGTLTDVLRTVRGGACCVPGDAARRASTPEKCFRQAEMLLLCSSSRERSRKDSSREVTCVVSRCCVTVLCQMLRRALRAATIVRRFHAISMQRVFGATTVASGGEEAPPSPSFRQQAMPEPCATAPNSSAEEERRPS